VAFHNVLKSSPSAPQKTPAVSLCTSFRQGPLIETSGQLDLSIEGPGFFSTLINDNIQYTRNGRFRVDSYGYLVTQDGYPVLGQSGPISPVASRKSDWPQGDVGVHGQEVDRLVIVGFPITFPARTCTSGMSTFS
jgi:flagellar basal-body rod protein FlgF